MEILRARIEDFEPIFGLLLANATWLHERGIEQWPVDWMEGQREEIRIAVEIGRFFVALHEGHAVAVVELRDEPEALWSYDRVNSLYIHKLAVDRRFSGKGIGRQLLNRIQLLAQERGYTYMRLDCVANNSWLKNYYCASGFTPVGTAHNGLVELALFQLTVGAKSG